MFDHKHYVPVLQWKRGEYLALRHVFPRDKARMTPLMQLPSTILDRRERSSGGVDERIGLVVGQIVENWESEPMFIDFGLLDDRIRTADGHHPIVRLFEEAHDSGLSLIPVTTLSPEGDYRDALRTVSSARSCGVCIRVSPIEILRDDFTNSIDALLRELNHSVEQVDIVIDFHILRDTPISYGEVLRKLPRVASWRSLTIAGGSFPVDLSHLTVGEHLTPRREWRRWIRLISHSDALPRIPTFADYCILHPVHMIPTGPINYSASIRYATDESWLVMRGQGVFTEDSAGFNQYPANALLLSERPEFCGTAFSYGDQYISEIASQSERTGNAETWLRAGVNHHLTFVVRQIARIFESSAVAAQ